MNPPLRDVQSEEPDLPLMINRVGVKGVHRRVRVYTPFEILSYDVEINAFVDLPGGQRGIHMSRTIEAMLEAIDEASKMRFKTLEELFEDACSRLLSKHSYASRAEIFVKTTRYFEGDSWREDFPETVDIMLKVSVERSRGIEWNVGVGVEGMTVCPCAQAIYSELEGINPESGLSHSQRAKLFIYVKTRGNLTRIEWLIEASKNAFSAPVVSLLKRRHEYELIKKAYRNPKFIEDVVRQALFNVAIKLREEKFPKDTEILVEGESWESIHPFNAYACKQATLGEILRELKF